MSAFCLGNNVRLLIHGSLCGEFLTGNWLGQPGPDAGRISDWSKMKYHRFIEATDGREVLQGIPRALDDVAAKHGVSISNVAARWVLDHPAAVAIVVVSGLIGGCLVEIEAEAVVIAGGRGASSNVF